MSEVKAPKKGDAGSKKSEAKKPEAEQSAAAAETSADKSAGKTDATPKSASQLSTSYFSSVSTPAYRSGWNSVFGSDKATKKTKLKTSNGDDYPDNITITDEDIDTELRNILYKAFQRRARNQGVSLAKIKRLAVIEYNLECNIVEKYTS